jgi:hypothetical protein
MKFIVLYCVNYFTVSLPPLAIYQVSGEYAMLYTPFIVLLYFTVSLPPSGNLPSVWRVCHVVNTLHSVTLFYSIPPTLWQSTKSRSWKFCIKNRSLFQPVQQAWGVICDYYVSPSSPHTCQNF